MAVWLDRDGKNGEFESAFFENGKIYLTWDILQDIDLSDVVEFRDVRQKLEQLMPNASPAKISNHGAQIFSFLRRIEDGDLIITPVRGQSSVAIGKVTGPYKFERDEKHMFRHSRNVNWLTIDFPRVSLEPDIRQGLCAMQTIVPIKAENADGRLNALVGGSSRVPIATHPDIVRKQAPVADESSETDLIIDLERSANEDIANLIIRKFKGHGLERLVEGILKAQGYTTYRSPEGPDGGVDLLAAAGPLGFSEPRICVQVKCTNAPVDHPTLQQLVGAMQTVKAQQGLLVSWSGFKSSVERARAAHFFSIRFWNQEDLIRELLMYYERLDEDLRVELPLKKIWVVSNAVEE